MFIIPWNDLSLVGTTDTDFNGSADEVHADSQDVDYLRAKDKKARDRALNRDNITILYNTERNNFV